MKLIDINGKEMEEVVVMVVVEVKDSEIIKIHIILVFNGLVAINKDIIVLNVIPKLH